MDIFRLLEYRYYENGFYLYDRFVADELSSREL
jgi:hypothetical protein